MEKDNTTLTTNPNTFQADDQKMKELQETIEKYRMVFGTPQEIAPYAYKIYEKGVSQETLREILINCEYDFNTDYIQISTIIDSILQDIYSGRAYSKPTILIKITEKERDYIMNFKDEQDRLILFSLLVNSKQNNHPSGWINFNIKKIFNQIDLVKISDMKKFALLNNLVKSNTYQMRVIGKKNPMACYFLPWRSAIDEAGNFVDKTENEHIVYEFELGQCIYARTFVKHALNLFKTLKEEEEK